MRTMTMLCVVLVGCGGSGGDNPGDDTAECSESADTCAGESICVAGICEDAFDRIYEITDVEVAVPTTDPNGDAWDIGGGAPDLLLEISVDGSVIASAPAVQDSFTASYPGPFTAQLIAGSTLLVATYDEDVTVNDPAYGCQAAPITADLLRGRVLACTGGGSSLSFKIDPR